MRLLQINPNGSDASALDLHPMVTVVRGLGAGGHDVIVRVVDALARGDDPGAGGLLEAHGVLLDLSADTLRLLDLHADIDVLVRRGDLPERSERATPSLPRASRDEVERFLEATEFGIHAELDAARRRRADAGEAFTILKEAAEKSHREFDRVSSHRRQVEALLDLAREQGEAADLEAASIEELRARHEDLRRTIDEQRLVAARAEQGLKELSGIDTRPLIVLLDAIRNPQPIELVPSERARELAGEYEQLQSRIGLLEDALAAQGLDSASAMKRLDDARTELAVAEKAMRKPEATEQDIIDLEAAHEAVIEAERKSTGVFKRGGQKALDEARRKEQEVLDHIGYPTWSAYVMGASLLSIDHAAEERLERARYEMEAADEHWARVCAAIQSNPEHGDLLNKLEDVYIEAYDLLSGEEPDDLAKALREVQVPKREVTTQELADALHYQLELVGLDLGEAPTDLIVMAAEAFIEEATAVAGRINELRDEKAAAEAQLMAATEQLEALPPLPEPEADEPVPAPESFSESFGAFGSADSFGDDEGFVGFGDLGFDEADAGEPDVSPESDSDESDTGESESGLVSFEDLGFGGTPETGPTPLDSFLAPAEHAVAKPESGAFDDLYALGATSEEPEPEVFEPEVFEPEVFEPEVFEPEVFEPEPEPATGGTSARIAELEREREAAIEEEAEYLEWMESREMLVDAAIQVETVAVSRLMKIASDLIAKAEGAGDASAEDADQTGREEDIEAIEFYLLGRLAAQRDISYAGSVPLVIDDALGDLDPEGIRLVLDKIEGMSESVQVIYLTDDPAIASWAEEVGFRRAAVVDAPGAFAA